ncbi:MAG TPA: NAD(P)-dependent oxidoreductase [Rhodanobacteraceae bacterium]
MDKPVLLVNGAKWGALLGDAVDNAFDVLRPWQAADPAALIDTRCGDVAAVFAASLDAELLARLPNLRLIVCPGAGYDGIPAAQARARGITIANAGATHSVDVAEYAITLALAAQARLPELQAWVRDDEWAHGEFPVIRNAWSAERFGIVGLGNIGWAIAGRLTAIGGDVAWWGPHAKVAPWPRHETLMDLARWCSVLLVAARGDARHLVDASIIDAVGANGTIVNIARGQVIDEDALIAALRSGRLGYAALDVFAHEPTPPARWQGVPHVIMTPHVAGVSRRSRHTLQAAAVQNLMHLIDGRPLVHQVAG